MMMMMMIGKGKSNVDLYSASSRTLLTRSEIMDHTVLPANNTIFAFTRKHSPGGVTTHSEPLTTHLSTPKGWMTELAMLANIQRTVYPEEVTRQLHVIAQARENSPVIKTDVLTTVLRHQQAAVHGLQYWNNALLAGFCQLQWNDEWIVNEWMNEWMNLCRVTLISSSVWRAWLVTRKLTNKN